MADGSCHLPARGGNSWIIFEVAHVDERPIEDGLSHDTRPTWRERVDSLEHVARRRRDAVMVSDQMNEMAVEPIYRCRHAVTQLHHALGDRIENRLHVRWRLADHPKDLARSRLLLQRLLRFVEQPHILDGDDRLVGKS